MNFRESYKKEMECIKHSKAIDEVVLQAMDKPVRRTGSSTGWKIAAVALVCVAVISTNFDALVGYADAVMGRFRLTAGNEEMALSEITPIDVDVEKHIAYEKTQVLEGGSYWCLYETQESLKEHTGIVISESANLELKDIMVDINMKYKTGHLSMDIFCDAGQYHMNGMFVIDGYDQSETGFGYGEEDKAYYVYEYSEGKRAYFIKAGEPGHMQSVYFSERGIMYQLFVENSADGKEIGKQLVDYMAE